MLTDEEIMEIRNHAKLNDNRQIDPLPFARDVIEAVLAKATPKQEPIGKICKSAECGGVDFYFDKIPDGETILYAGPRPAQAAENPLVDAVFTASHKKATDTHGKCPHCSHECAQAAIPDNAVKVLIDDLKRIHRDLDACQKVIWLAGGFDPEYCKDAQESLKLIDSALSASPKPE